MRMNFDNPTFADLFAGIGGFRLAFEAAGGSCAFSSEIDRFARQTYAENFGDEPAGDIRVIQPADIPDFDILCGGFPCQPFSLAGVSKKQSLGRPHGFSDRSSGPLFFEVARILRAKRPPALLLENVAHLQHHDGGRTFEVIKNVLTRDLGYHIDWKVYDSAKVVPQKRERIFIVGFLEADAASRFQFPALRKPAAGLPRLGDILERRVPPKYRLSDRLWKSLQRHAERHRAAGNGFGYRKTPRAGVARTLSARYYKDGSEILVPVRGGNPRRLTPRECARLMGFPESFRIVVSDTQAYKQFGNSVVVPVVRPIARAVVRALCEARVVAA